MRSTLYILLFTAVITWFHIYTNRVTSEELVNKLTYHKNLMDCLLNYSLILLGILLIYHSSSKGLTIVSVAVLIQMIILLHSKAFGVSLVWCVILGMILARKRTKKETAYLIASCVILMYYTFKFGILSTTAHLLAILTAYLLV